MNYRPEPTDAFDSETQEAYRCCPECLFDWDECHCPENCDDEPIYEGEDEDDGQPTEYEEWQDFYGGDDWDWGQYDCYDEC
jgi:hypothetical protein